MVDDFDSEAVRRIRLKEFLDFRSFIELEELNILDSKGFENVFSDNDLIGFQLRDYDYATQAYTNIMPSSMKLMSYYQNETFYYKTISAGNNKLSLIMLYSDKAGSTNSHKFIFYAIKEDPSTNLIKNFNYTISLLSARNSEIYGKSNEIIINNSFIGLNREKFEMINPNDFMKKSNLMDLKSMNAIDCLINHDTFGTLLAKKPIIKFDYSIEHGNYPGTNWDHGSIIIGDYDNATQAYTELELGNAPSDTGFARGVVSICAPSSKI